MNIERHIIDRVSKEMLLVEPMLQEWLKSHMISPKKVELYMDVSFSKKKEYWLITDHNGHNDSNSRVVYCEENDSFGLDFEDKERGFFFMGYYGCFSDTVNAI